MDLTAIRDLILLQQSTAARLQFLEEQIKTLIEEVKSIQRGKQDMTDMISDSTEQLITAFHKTQSLSLDLISEFRKLKGTVIKAMIATIGAVLVISMGAAWTIVEINRSDAADQLTSIIANQESIEDVLISNTAMHTKTQSMLETQCGGK